MDRTIIKSSPQLDMSDGRGELDATKLIERIKNPERPDSQR